MGGLDDFLRLFLLLHRDDMTLKVRIMISVLCYALVATTFSAPTPDDIVPETQLPQSTAGIVWLPGEGDTAVKDIPDDALPFVFPYPVKGSCGAALISPTHAITAAHCFDGTGVHNAVPPFNVNIDGSSHTVVKVLKNECFKKSGGEDNGADLAIMVLKTPVNGVKIPKIYPRTDEVGKTMSVVGWGDYGAFKGAAVPQCGETDKGCTQLRTGSNSVKHIKDNCLIFYLTTGTALTMAGDSGSPGLYKDPETDETYIMGLVSGGGKAKHNGKTVLKGSYVRLSSKWSQDWIKQTIAHQDKFDNGIVEETGANCAAMPRGSSASSPKTDKDDDEEAKAAAEKEAKAAAAEKAEKAAKATAEKAAKAAAEKAAKAAKAAEERGNKAESKGAEDKEPFGDGDGDADGDGDGDGDAGGTNHRQD